MPCSTASAGAGSLVICTRTMAPSTAMAIAASHSLDMPRQQAFWLLHLGGWGAYFAQGCLYAVAHGKPSGYWVVPLTATITAGSVPTMVSTAPSSSSATPWVSR